MFGRCVSTLWLSKGIRGRSSDRWRDSRGSRYRCIGRVGIGGGVEVWVCGGWLGAGGKSGGKVDGKDFEDEEL